LKRLDKHSFSRTLSTLSYQDGRNNILGPHCLNQDTHPSISFSNLESVKRKKGKPKQTMSAKSTKGPGGKKPASAATNLVAGGGAGMMEALACHPLDTIKVRMQLSKRSQRGVSFSNLSIPIPSPCKSTFWKPQI
jgi:hypothetical protein